MKGTRYSILIADDEPEIVTSIGQELQELGRRFKDDVVIYEAFCGSDVQRILGQSSIDVVFLDYHFAGGMSGDEIINAIDDPFGQMLIILMSGRSKAELEGVVIKRHKQLGDRFRFLRKPIDDLQLEAQYLEIGQFYSTRPYPFPLAYAYDGFLNSTNALGQLHAVKDVIESFTKYSVAIFASDAISRDLTFAIPNNIRWDFGLTLGAWLNWLNRLVKSMFAGGTETFMPELLELLAVGITTNMNYLGLMSKFKDEVRDSQLGHGYVREDPSYAVLVDEYEDILHTLFADLRFMTRYQLLVPESTDFPEDDSYEIEYRVRLLMGADTRFPLLNFRSRSRLKRGRVYICAPDGTLLSLDPFFIYELCRECSFTRLYVLDKVCPSQIEYNAFCNHRRLDKKRAPIFWGKVRMSQDSESAVDENTSDSTEKRSVGDG